MTTETTSPLDSASKFVAVAASLSLPMSLIYDWGFYTRLGLSLTQIPTSLIDHARGAVVWFPLLLVAFLPGLVWVLLIGRLNAIATPPKSPSKDMSIRAKLFRAAPDILYFGACVVWVGSYVIYGDEFLGAAVIGGIFIWTTYSIWALSASRSDGNIAWRLAIIYIPIVAAMVWAAGRGEAIKLIHEPVLSTVVVVGAAAPETMAIIRYVDKGVLFRDARGVVIFRRWDSISSIATPTDATAGLGILCHWFKHCAAV